MYVESFRPLSKIVPKFQSLRNCLKDLPKHTSEISWLLAHPYIATLFQGTQGSHWCQEIRNLVQNAIM